MSHQAYKLLCHRHNYIITTRTHETKDVLTDENIGPLMGLQICNYSVRRHCRVLSASAWRLSIYLGVFCPTLVAWIPQAHRDFAVCLPPACCLLAATINMYWQINSYFSEQIRLSYSKNKWIHEVHKH